MLIRLFQHSTICSVGTPGCRFRTICAHGGYVMKARRKIIVYIATSADGYIARPDGDVEWLNRRPRTVDYGMREFYPTIDTILWGRKTYDWVLNYYKKKVRRQVCSTRSSRTTCSRGNVESGRCRGLNSYQSR